MSPKLWQMALTSMADLIYNRPIKTNGGKKI